MSSCDLRITLCKSAFSGLSGLGAIFGQHGTRRSCNICSWELNGHWMSEHYASLSRVCKFMCRQHERICHPTSTQLLRMHKILFRAICWQWPRLKVCLGSEQWGNLVQYKQEVELICRPCTSLLTWAQFIKLPGKGGARKRANEKAFSSRYQLLRWDGDGQTDRRWDGPLGDWCFMGFRAGKMR